MDHQTHGSKDEQTRNVTTTPIQQKAGIKLIFMNSDDRNEPNNPQLAPIDAHRRASQSIAMAQEAAPQTPVENPEDRAMQLALTATSVELPAQENAVDSLKRTNDGTNTPAKAKKSRKLQGVGIKKPLYSKYETLFIIKAFKAISDLRPNLVLVDLFKVVAELYNKEAKKQGFKERTGDQLYQKYKRIQYGLNHDAELEFLGYFKRNKHCPKEWIPDFQGLSENDTLNYIMLDNVEETIERILGTGSSGDVKPQLQPIDDVEERNNDTNNSLVKVKQEPRSEDMLIHDLRAQIQMLEERLRSKDYEIYVLREGNVHRDNEISFLKTMLKEEISYIRHKLNEQ